MQLLKKIVHILLMVMLFWKQGEMWGRDELLIFTMIKNVLDDGWLIWKLLKHATNTYSFLLAYVHIIALLS